jgi:hypothetical protein
MHTRTNTFPDHPPRHNHAQRGRLTLGPAGYATTSPHPCKLIQCIRLPFLRSLFPCGMPQQSRSALHCLRCGVAVPTRRTCEPCFCTTRHSSFTTSSSVTPAPKPFSCSATRRGTEWQKLSLAFDETELVDGGMSRRMRPRSARTGAQSANPES